MESTQSASCVEQAIQICRSNGWTLKEEIDSGGSAIVYETDTEHGSSALKVFFEHYITGKEGAVTKRRLSIAKERLTGHQCDSLVKIHHIDEIGGLPYMLMERVVGHKLSDVLESVPPSLIDRLVQKVAEAAKYLELSGLTHRDIKSDNVIVNAGFDHATLVDVGVARAIDDPVGSGTDDEGSLPFVATARYSSPEYMFRLMQPGPDLWRALNFYQLGGLIHDLVTGELLFDDIVRASSGNRYIVAHAVATKVPSIVPREGVPRRLINLAQRCLEKDPAIRLSTITWDDFTGRDRLREKEALLGLLGDRRPRSTASVLNLPEIGRNVKESIDSKLMSLGLSCRHRLSVVDERRVRIRISWQPPALSREIDVVLELDEDSETLAIFAYRDDAGTPDDPPSTPRIRIAASSADLAPSAANHSYSAFIDASAETTSIEAESKS